MMQTKFRCLSTIAAACAGLAWAGTAPIRVSGNDGQVVMGSPPDSPSHIIHALKDARIIPEVVNAFAPSVWLNVTWLPDSHVDLGNDLDPKKLVDGTWFSLLVLPARGSDVDFPPANVVIVLTDPDARSREKPDWSEYCHWILGDYITYTPDAGRSDLHGLVGDTAALAMDIPLNSFRPEPFESESRSQHRTFGPLGYEQELYGVTSYKAPAPPPKTGKHRYVFFALTPANGTTDRIYPSKPKNRKHWGYGGVRVGVRKWAEENGLVVSGANFFYAQNKKQ